MWTESDPSAKRYMSYMGALPEHLYRYRSVSAENVDRLVTFEILDEGIYLAGLTDLNDPDEGRFIVTMGNDYAKVLDFWRSAIGRTDPTMPLEEVEATAKANSDELAKSGYLLSDSAINRFRSGIDQLIRVACFTTQPTNYSMWANYAKFIDPAGRAIDHAGICIEYRCNEGWRNTTLHPVEYDDTIPEINVVSRDENEFSRAIYRKAREWRCEQEWRITSVIMAKPPVPSNFTANSRIRLQNAVASVIFGLKTPDSLIDEFRSRITPVKPEIAFKRVTKDPRSFARMLVTL